MVLISNRAYNDLIKYFNGLLNWSAKTKTKDRENHLSREHAELLYVKVLDACLSMDSLNYHSKARYYDHEKYGKYVHPHHSSNRRTTIYIIYDIDKNDVIHIKKITTNYKTISGI
jgi:hypothetical protein